jgi:hypothetical protein
VKDKTKDNNEKKKKHDSKKKNKNKRQQQNRIFICFILLCSLGKRFRDQRYCIFQIKLILIFISYYSSTSNNYNTSECKYNDENIMFIYFSLVFSSSDNHVIRSLR